MADFRKVSEHLSVSPQLSPADIDAAADAGFKTVLCNRPDGEGGPLQPNSADLAERAKARGLTFLFHPFSGVPNEEIIAKQRTLIAEAEGPVLAFCRTGTRSITAWALAQTEATDKENVIAQAAEAGYDLSGLRG